MCEFFLLKDLEQITRGLNPSKLEKSTCTLAGGKESGDGLKARHRGEQENMNRFLFTVGFNPSGKEDKIIWSSI